MMESKQIPSFSGLKTMQLNDMKAGMEGLDKETINSIIHEASKGTPYFSFQEKRQLSIDNKVKELQLMIKKITEKERKESIAKMDALCQSLEKKRDLTHSIVHIDMDAFYAAVEMHDNPELKHKPMAVGSSSMLSTSNYHARKFGVRAAMPGFIAKKLCPDLIIVPCNFAKYRAVSKIIQSIVEEYDPHYSAASLDEVYMDLTPFIQKKYKEQLHEQCCLRNADCAEKLDESNSFGDTALKSSNCIQCSKSISDEIRDKMAYEIVAKIREKIFKATELTASAGIAPNTMLAKVCSDQNKPNGQYQIVSTADAVKSFLSTLLVKKVSGIGPVQGQILNAIGINTCADMWAHRDLVANLFTSNSIEFYMRVALGIGSTTVRSDHVRKSIGNERTFREIFQPSDLHKMCEELCSDLIEDLKSHNLVGKVIVLKIKTTDFKCHTRNHSLASYTGNPEIIHNAAKRLLDAEISSVAPQHLRLRLMGVRMCNLVDADSISSNEKQQVTLKTFLESKMATSAKSPSKISETVTAPIDSKALEASCVDNVRDSEMEEENDHISNLSKYENIDNEGKSFDYTSQTSEQTKGEITNYFCPVCELTLRVNNLIEFNDHIDRCLNRKAIKEILSAENITAKRKILYLPKDNPKNSKMARKEKRIEDYFR